MNVLNLLISYAKLTLTSKWVVWPLVLPLVGLLVLAVKREILFNENLFDVERRYLTVECPEVSLYARTADGTCNDLSHPSWGAAGRRFGRNIDPETLPERISDSEILDPNPREISLELMSRDQFIPEKQLNLLAAAWIQFMIHDWFDHGPNDRNDPIKVRTASSDPFFGRMMKVYRTKRDTTYDSELDRVVTYRNEVTHWWDGSQLYGSSLKKQNTLREFAGGRLKMKAGFLPKTRRNEVLTGFNDNWWVGLSLMHTLFAREHNKIAHMLAEAYPSMGDQELFDKARLINSGLMTKIHTLEWTTAILDNPVLIQGMYSNWYGIGPGQISDIIDSVGPYAELIQQVFGTQTSLDFQKMGDKAINGIVGNETDSYGVPYSLTEEFVSVYRMHPLVPDEFSIYNLSDKQVVANATLDKVRNQKGEKLIRKHGLANLVFSFGKEHPGALTLNNYPRAMQNIRIPLLGVMDLASIDIIRDRERGVPRYNEFRRQVGLKPIDAFEDLFQRFGGEQLTEEQQMTVTKMRRIYGDVERLDLMVGMMAESVRPAGYGFGETAFQIFTLMASRRLLSDRFYTEDFRPEVYTPEGIDWVQNRSFKDVIKDHIPALALKAEIPDNAFKPW